MRKLFFILLTVTMFINFPLAEAEPIDSKTGELNISVFEDYTKEFESEELEVCSNSSTKTYMDYRAVTSRSSAQYKYIHEYMTVDENTGFLYDKDGFIGVATGSYYGVIGDKFYFTLDSGVVLPVVKIDEKSDNHTINGCAHAEDGSVLEFVIDSDYAADSEYFGRTGNGLIVSGNYNNFDLFNGKIESVEKVGEKKKDKIVFNFDMINLSEI